MEGLWTPLILAKSNFNLLIHEKDRKADSFTIISFFRLLPSDFSFPFVFNNTYLACNVLSLWQKLAIVVLYQRGRATVVLSACEDIDVLSWVGHSTKKF